MSRTQDIVRAVPPQSAETFTWDIEVPQLAERHKGRSRSWIIQFRVGEQTVRRKVGDVETLPIDLARVQAKALLKKLAEHPEGPSNPTLAQFAPRFLIECAPQWKASTLNANRCGIERQILPQLGAHRVKALTREDVLHWRSTLSVSAGTTNRALAVLSSLMRHAEILGLRHAGSNPCAGLRKRSTSFKADYLDNSTYAAFGQILKRSDNRFPLATPCLRFITLTGCRKSEAVAALWDKLDGNRLALPDSKSGPKSIWLGRPVLDLLATLPRHGAGIFAGDDVKSLEAEMRRLWKEIRAELGRPSLRIHDLRHSYASVAVNSGLNLQVIGGLLGHSDLDSTAGYAHLDVNVVKQASARVGDHLAKAFAPPKRGRPRKRPLPLACTPHFESFEEQTLPLHMFCTKHRLDPGQFLTAYTAWQKAQNNSHTSGGVKK